MKQEHSTITTNFKTKDTPEGDKFVYPQESSLAIDKATDNTVNRIYRYYHNEKSRVTLTDYENLIRERWEKAWLLACRHRTRKEVVDLLCKLFTIEKRTAYDDYRNALMLFSDPNENTKEAKRTIAETMALRGMDKCWKKGDMDGYHKFLKEYTKINQLENVDDNNLGDLLKNLKPHTILIVSNKEELEAQAHAIQESIAQDIAHEEIEGESN